MNHDAAHRPRRQDREPEYAETGAFYVFRTAGFLSGGPPLLRTRGHPARAAAHAIEIDDATDLERARALAPQVDRALASDAGTTPHPATTRGIRSSTSTRSSPTSTACTPTTP